MYFDVTWFGYGLGLVVLGYSVGLAVGLVFSLISRISSI